MVLVTILITTDITSARAILQIQNFLEVKPSLKVIPVILRRAACLSASLLWLFGFGTENHQMVRGNSRSRLIMASMIKAACQPQMPMPQESNGGTVAAARPVPERPIAKIGRAHV